MRMLTLTAASLIAAAPIPALAQNAPADSGTDIETAIEAETATSEIAEQLSDPETQEKLTRSLQVLGDVLLDLPLAPLMEAASEMSGEITGEDPEMVDPDMTLREMSPDAERVPEEMAEKVPQMMDAMAGMARGMGAMLPALRKMAAQMEEAMEGLEEDAR